jgi:hypothetical protein
MVTRTAALLTAALLSAPRLLHAQADQTAPAPEPTPAAAPAERMPGLHHAPVSVATAHEDLLVSADITFPERVRRAVLLYRSGEEPAFRAVEFRRSHDGPYVAVIPGAHVEWPALAYTIEMEDTDGRRRAVFASRKEPFSVLVPEDLMDVRERVLDQRLGGLRSVFSASADYVSFGSSGAALEDSTGTITRQSVDDRYYRIEGSYTYRPLRIITEFSVRVGVVRGKAPVPLREPLPGQSESERFDVGLNYGAPRVRFRVHDLVHMEGEVLSSVTEVGFSWGGGGALLLGDPYGTKLTLGFESIQTFGNRFYSRMDVAAAPGLHLAPIVEVTNMPSADRYGVRLLGEVGIDVGGGFSFAARGGYQAREAASGGVALGTTLAYAF